MNKIYTDFVRAWDFVASPVLWSPITRHCKTKALYRGWRYLHRKVSIIFVFSY